MLSWNMWKFTKFGGEFCSTGENEWKVLTFVNESESLLFVIVNYKHCDDLFGTLMIELKCEYTFRLLLYYKNFC